MKIQKNNRPQNINQAMDILLDIKSDKLQRKDGI